MYVQSTVQSMNMQIPIEGLAVVSLHTCLAAQRRWGTNTGEGLPTEVPRQGRSNGSCV